jgi:hypothetical protein
MRHARNRSTAGRSLAATTALGALVVVLAACSGTSAAPAATAAPNTAAALATPRITQAPATPAPTGQLVVVTPPPAPAVFDSPLYGYTLSLTNGAEVTGVSPATARWDGASAIASDGPMVDQFRRSGSRLAFILSAPTDLDLDVYATAVHAKAVTEHGCPEEVTSVRDLVVGGSPARVVAFVCRGLHVYEATMVRDGIGLIAKQITPPPGSPVLEEESLDDFMRFVEPLELAW